MKEELISMSPTLLVLEGSWWERVNQLYLEEPREWGWGDEGGVGLLEDQV